MILSSLLDKNHGLHVSMGSSQEGAVTPALAALVWMKQQADREGRPFKAVVIEDLSRGYTTIQTTLATLKLEWLETKLPSKVQTLGAGAYDVALVLGAPEEGTGEPGTGTLPKEWKSVARHQIVATTSVVGAMKTLQKDLTDKGRAMPEDPEGEGPLTKMGAVGRVNEETGEPVMATEGRVSRTAAQEDLLPSGRVKKHRVAPSAKELMEKAANYDNIWDAYDTEQFSAAFPQDWDEPTSWKSPPAPERVAAIVEAEMRAWVEAPSFLSSPEARQRSRERSEGELKDLLTRVGAEAAKTFEESRESKNLRVWVTVRDGRKLVVFKSAKGKYMAALKGRPRGYPGVPGSFSMSTYPPVWEGQHPFRRGEPLHSKRGKKSSC